MYETILYYTPFQIYSVRFDGEFYSYKDIVTSDLSAIKLYIKSIGE